jgi:hypothetical protein
MFSAIGTTLRRRSRRPQTKGVMQEILCWN